MNIFDILLICLKKKRVLVIIPLVCASISFFIVSFMPKSYYTESRLSVNDPNGSSISIMEGLNKNLGNFFGKAKQDESKEIFMEIISGRDNMVALINKFRLEKFYKKKSIDLTLKALSKDLNISLEDNGVIVCGFTSKDIALAVNIVQFLVNNANNRYIELQKERIVLNNQFLKEKQSQLMDSLNTVNKELISFYRENNIINLEKQIELSLYALSNYEQQFRTFQVEKNFVDITIDKSAPQAEMYKDKIKILQTEFSSLRGKTENGYQPNRNSILINTDWGLQKLLFEKILVGKIEVLKDFVSAISKEQALTESNLSRNIPVVQILQSAFIPDWKIKPKRSTWMIASFVLALALSVFLVIASAYLKGELKGNEELRKRYLELLNTFKKI